MLHWPAYSKHDAKLSLTISMGFNRVGCLPRIIILSRLDDDVGTEAIFRQHKAKSRNGTTLCKLQFNKSREEEISHRKQYRCF